MTTLLHFLILFGFCHCYPFQRFLQEQARQAERQRQEQETLRQQQAAAQQKTQQEALQRQQQLLVEQQKQQQEAAAKKQQQLAQQAAAKQIQQQRSQTSTPGSQQGGAIDLLPSGLGGLSLGSNTAANSSPSASINSKKQGGDTATVGSPSSGRFDASSNYLGAIDESFLHCPSNFDSERQRTYTPRNPYLTPSSYPTSPSLIFENPAIFEKLGTDCLFFIFYYAQGTYQQYLAARELKKQSWRYHKKYMTWFQRHEEPKVTTEEYEQGTYVYFDYESGWCQRIKSDFRFEYSYLEDSLQ